MDKISVIIPAYNIEEFIAECLTSVRNQSYQNIEVIVVDDGSTDATGAICDSFSEADKRITVIHQDNAGPAEARNTGLRIAAGNYISFIDGDDKIEVEFIEVLHRMITSGESDIACCGFYGTCVRGPAQHYEKKNDRVFNREEWIENILTANDIKFVMWNKLFKRNVLEGLQLRKVAYGEDMDFFFDYIDHTDRIIFNPVSTYYYRERETSITRTGFNQNKLEIIRPIEKMIVYIKSTYPRLSKYALIRGMDLGGSILLDMFKNNCYELQFLERYRKIVREGLFIYCRSNHLLSKKLFLAVFFLSPGFSSFLLREIYRHRRKR